MDKDGNVSLLTRHKFIRPPLLGVACLAALTFASCSGIEKTQAATNAKAVPTKLTLENFTTEGKPTKTIETPWGPREIYDPIQDQEISQVDQHNADLNNDQRNLINLASQKYTSKLTALGCQSYLTSGCDVCSTKDVNRRHVAQNPQRYVNREERVNVCIYYSNRLESEGCRVNGVIASNRFETECMRWNEDYCANMKYADVNGQSFLVFENNCDRPLKWSLCSNSYDHPLMELKEGMTPSLQIDRIPYNSKGEHHTLDAKRCLGVNCVTEPLKCQLPNRAQSEFK